VKDPSTASSTERVGRYQLLEPIGSGPSGTVSRAKVFGVAGFERQFAIKRFAPELTVLSSHAQALSAAARSYGSLEHPRVARMNEFGVAQGVTFTAVEHVAGLDSMRLLAETRLSGNALATGGVLALISQAARAVGYAHGRGISHLGLAPTNVIVTPDGDVKVTDFGILSATLPPRPIDTARLAKRIAYLAPEQLTGESTSAATDVFALGVLAYEMLGGQPVFRGDTPQQIAQTILAGPPPDPMLPRPIVRVLQRCLARSPFERFPDARALADALDAALRVAPVPGTRKDIGSQVKAAMDRIAQLNDNQMSGMLALHVGTGPDTEPVPLVPPPRDSIDLETNEFVRPDTPVKGPSPLVGPAKRAPREADPAATAPELPKTISTVPGLPPPPIPVPPGVAMPPNVITQAPPASPTLVGVGAKKLQTPPVIPRIMPRKKQGEAAAAAAADKPSLPRQLANSPVAPVVKPVSPTPPITPGPPRGMTNLLDDLQDEPGSEVHLNMTVPGLAAEKLMDAETVMSVADKRDSASIAKAIDEEIAQDPRVETVADIPPDPADAELGPNTMLGFTPARPGTPPPDRKTPPPERKTPALERKTPAPERKTPAPPVRRTPARGQAVVREPAPPPPAPPLAPPPAPPPPAEPTSGEMVAIGLDGFGGNTATKMMPEGELDLLNKAVRAPEEQVGAVLIDPFGGDSLVKRHTPPPIPAMLPPMTPGEAAEKAAQRTQDVRAQAPGKRRWPLIAIIVVLVGGLGGAGYYIWSQMESPSDQVAVGGSGKGSSPVTVPKGSGSATVVKAGSGSGSAAVKAAGSGSATGSGSGSATGSGSAIAVAVGSGSGSGSAVAMVHDAGVAAPDAAAVVKAPADAGVAQPTGTSDALQIASTPSGARVFLDGADQGVTPLKLQGTADRHNLSLLLSGYELYAAQVDGHGQFNIEMKPVTPLGGPAGIKVLNCKQKERYYVFVDGKPTGMTCPTERIHCDIGAHTVEVYDVITESRQKFDIKVTDTRLSYRVRIE
jgi:serine/threonine protein kinase